MIIVKTKLCREKITGNIYSFHKFYHNSNIGETASDDVVATAPIIPNNLKIVSNEYATLNLESGCWPTEEFNEKFDIVKNK